MLWITCGRTYIKMNLDVKWISSYENVSITVDGSFVKRPKVQACPIKWIWTQKRPPQSIHQPIMIQLVNLHSTYEIFLPILIQHWWLPLWLKEIQSHPPTQVVHRPVPWLVEHRWSIIPPKKWTWQSRIVQLPSIYESQCA